MTKWRTKIPKWLRQAEDWDEWQSALAFATIWPRLLAPDRKRQRSRIRTLYYLVLLERMRGVKGRSASSVRETIIARLKSRLTDLAHTTRIEWYRQQLFLDTKAGPCTRPALTTGLLVKVLASPNGVRNGRRVVNTATEYLIENYQSGIAITGDEDEAEKIWRKWKHAAHLCAALVDYLPLNSTPQINAATLQKLEENMGGFVKTAIYYQEFLTGKREIGEITIPDATRRSFELAVLDPIQLSVPGFAKAELPIWDRKRGVALRKEAPASLA